MEMKWTKHQYMSQEPGFTDDIYMAIMERRKEEAKNSGH